MAERLLKVKGTQLYYQDYSEVEHLLTGSVVEGTFAGNLKVKGIYLHYMDNDGVQRRLLGTLTGETGVLGKLWNKGDYLYYIDNNGDERYIPVGPDLLIDHDPTYASSSTLFADNWYGNTFRLPFDFKLAKIAVRHNQYGEEVCAIGRLDLRTEPHANSAVPTLIETSTRWLPSLPLHPASVFVEYTFSQPLLLADTMYSFFAVGCSPAFAQPYYRLAIANYSGYCAGCCSWTYNGHTDPQTLVYSATRSRQHKIWGYPV